MSVVAPPESGRIPAGQFAHAGERAVQRRTGLAFPGPIRNYIPQIATDFLLTQRVVVVAGRDAERRVWATMLAGEPGFMQVPEPRTLEVHATPADGDPLAQLVEAGGEVGVIAVDRNHRMRVNGVLSADTDGFTVHTVHVYANCHKHISERHPMTIEGARALPSPTVASNELSAAQIDQIRSADTFFIGSSHPDGPSDASHRGGNPGFIIVDSPNRLHWPNYTGNSMFNTLGNIVLDPHVGLLFPDWTNGDLLQISGCAYVNWDPEAAAALPGAQRVVEMDVEAVRHTRNATGLRWTDPVLSKFNY